MKAKGFNISSTRLRASTIKANSLRRIQSTQKFLPGDYPLNTRQMLILRKSDAHRPQEVPSLFFKF